jgi:4-amino-4-deoxy-L-arabinose transferase-like glycosyltransferase
MKIDIKILLLAVIIIVIGIVITPDYGISWDEPDNAIYGQQALNTYLTFDPPEEWHSNLESKGPFYMAFSVGFSAVLSSVVPNWSEIEGLHFSYYVSFPLAVVAFYTLAKKIGGQSSALAATLLFATQPLLFGHAFINPKDIPFMSFFLITMSLGSMSIERIQSTQTLSKSDWLIVVATGVSLGVTSSLRVIGTFAFFLLLLWGFYRCGREFLGPSITILGVVALTIYASWPYLWAHPIRNLIESLSITLNFPWDNLVLYRGLVYPVDKLPWHYLPFITVIQLTEPLLLLGTIGGLLVSASLVKNRLAGMNGVFIIYFLWIAVPYGFALITGSTVYDNSRQFLFALPPIALFTAPAFRKIFDMVKKQWLQVAFFILIVFPGLYGIFRLHPYEYIYYNALVGGVQGAYRTYELDYWGTSYKEAMEYINNIAPKGAVVEVRGPWKSASAFSREDITVLKADANIPNGLEPASFFIVSTRRNEDQSTFTEAQVITQIEVVGVPLSVIKQK